MDPGSAGSVPSLTLTLLRAAIVRAAAAALPRLVLILILVLILAAVLAALVVLVPSVLSHVI